MSISQTERLSDENNQKPKEPQTPDKSFKLAIKAPSWRKNSVSSITRDGKIRFGLSKKDITKKDLPAEQIQADIKVLNMDETPELAGAEVKIFLVSNDKPLHCFHIKLDNKGRFYDTLTLPPEIVKLINNSDEYLYLMEINTGNDPKKITEEIKAGIEAVSEIPLYQMIFNYSEINKRRPSADGRLLFEINMTQREKDQLRILVMAIHDDTSLENAEGIISIEIDGKCIYVFPFQLEKKEHGHSKYREKIELPPEIAKEIANNKNTCEFVIDILR